MKRFNIFLLTGNCGYLLLPAFNDSEFKPTVVYSGLPIEGTTANLICPPGLALTGTNSTTCMSNGEWKPEPWELECRGLSLRINLSPPLPHLHKLGPRVEWLNLVLTATNCLYCGKGVYPVPSVRFETSSCFQKSSGVTLLILLQMAI